MHKIFMIFVRNLEEMLLHNANVNRSEIRMNSEYRLFGGLEVDYYLSPLCLYLVVLKNILKFRS